MIDWITAVVRAQAAFDLKTGEVSSCDADGVEEWSCPKRLDTRGSHDAKVTVRKSGGCAVEISGSPA